MLVPDDDPEDVLQSAKDLELASEARDSEGPTEPFDTDPATEEQGQTMRN